MLRAVVMSDQPDMNNPVIAASAAQERASDPLASVFVSANAGTGKTKLLTDRVLRLLLAGAEADGILCVTYTRAAAAEMRNRIAVRLANWAIMPTAELTADLGSMGIVTPSQDMIARARRLFAQTLDNDNGPRVETVHSFCQSILRRFPIEAGVAPNAVLADDAEQFRLRAMARDLVLRSGDLALTTAVLTLAEQSSEDDLDDVLNSFVGRAKGLNAPDLLPRLSAYFEEELGAGTPSETAAELGSLIADIDDEGLRAVAAVLGASGKKNHIARSVKFDLWLALDAEGRARRIDILIDCLFTNGKPYAERSLSNKDIRAELPTVVPIQQHIQNLLTPWLSKLAAQRCRELTEAIYRYGAAYQKQYQALKMARGLLDYDDLIVVTNNLMARSEAAQWVAWKLDNGISHLLIDEAQDTSPAQWALLRRLSEEFFENQNSEQAISGQGELQRTIFAVGDFKQSIYSFQGADPAVMSANRRSLAEQAKERLIDFRELSLSVSFRSSAPVLDLVNAVIPDQPGIEDFTPHQVARQQAGGFVELWPVIQSNETRDDAPGFTPPEIAAWHDAGAQSARELATIVKSWIGMRVLSKGNLMRAGDVLILLSKRDRYFEQVLSALQDEAIPIAGADRMKLEEQIEIQDLLALGDVMLLPEDDLQLAVLLKSPLFGMDEDQLFALAHDRGAKTLYSRLMTHAGGDSDLGQMADKLERWRHLSGSMSVFDFYSHVLMNGGRAALHARLGAGVAESLDHFLTLAQNAAHMSLTEFVLAIRGVGGEVKRDLDNGDADEVRVMTIHGAKGLEAPVVILPDMLESRKKTDRLVDDPKSGIIYFNPGSGLATEFLEQAKAHGKALRQMEANRLLYVALTRACEGLVIGGWKSAARFDTECNYNLIRNAMETIPDVQTGDDGVLRLVKNSSEAVSDVADSGGAPDLDFAKSSIDAVDWLFKPAPHDAENSRPFRPSQPGSDFVPQSIASNPIGRNAALERGKFAHRLFEILPTLPEDQRRTIAARMLANQSEIAGNDTNTIIDDVMRVIDDTRLARLFGPDALAEVSINGMVEGVGVAGQIDRFHVGETDILIADFKTGTRPDGPPPANYCLQMALYAALLGDIYPGKTITSWLVWSESTSVQEISNDERNASLERFRAGRHGAA